MNNESVEAVTEADARHALAMAGVPADGTLHKAFSYSNHVWVGDDHVVLIGRPGQRLLAHQARILEALPPEVPHADVVAFTETETDQVQRLVLTRAAGVTVHEAWPGLGERERRSVVAQLATGLEALHAVGDVERFRHHWVDEPDLETYQQPPRTRFPVLLEVARALPIADQAFLDALEAFMDERLDAFTPADERVLVHTDVHNKNLLCDLDAPGGPRLTAILDFEFARPAARDLELDVVLRYGVLPMPDLAEETRRAEVKRLARWLHEDYSHLFAHPRLVDRLEAYAVMYDLRQCVGWAAPYPDAPVWNQLRELVAGRGYVRSSVAAP